jgi:hypothetical protein
LARSAEYQAQHSSGKDLCMKILAVLAIALLSSSLQARPVVVELFTSQGCSSCPPADKVLTRLSQQKDVIALTWPVTIWDRLGWKDTFARASNTQRQYAYNTAFGENGVYTPQAIIDGQTHTIGSHQSALALEIAGRQKQTAKVVVTLAKNAAGDVALSVGPSDEAVDVRFLRVKSAGVVAIGRGENGGEKLTYSNIVLSDAVIATGSKPVSQTLPGEKSDAVAVLVESKRTHAILGAAMLALK